MKLLAIACFLAALVAPVVSTSAADGVTVGSGENTSEFTGNYTNVYSPTNTSHPAQQQTKTKPLKIGVIVYAGAMILDYIGPTSYFEFLPYTGVTPVEFHTISQKRGVIESSTVMPIYASMGYADAPEQLDILLIPGSGDNTVVTNDKGFLDYIRRVAQKAKFVLTVCTGAEILAQTGFLDGKRATTNKIFYDKLVEPHKNVKWIRQARWVVDGNTWTSSGITAGMDMAYAFVADQYGAEAADNIAKTLETVPNKDPSNDPFA